MRSNPGLHGHIWLFDRERIELTVPELTGRWNPQCSYYCFANQLAEQIHSDIERGESGGTYDRGGRPLRGENEGRYIVGCKLFRACPGFPLDGLATPQHVAEAIEVIHSHITGLCLDCYEPVAVGYWIENGRCHFDAGNVLDDRDRAIGLALQRGEEAVFDLFRGELIHTRTHRSWSGWIEYNRNRHRKTQPLCHLPI